MALHLRAGIGSPRLGGGVDYAAWDVDLEEPGTLSSGCAPVAKRSCFLKPAHRASPIVTADAQNRHSATLRVPAQHPALAGHFPGNPIVPGVVVLDAVVSAAEAWLGAGFRVDRLTYAKFLAPLKPERPLESNSCSAGRCLTFPSIGDKPRSRRGHSAAPGERPRDRRLARTTRGRQRLRHAPAGGRGTRRWDARSPRALLLPITAYFMIRRGPERRASRAYLARVLGRPRPGSRSRAISTRSPASPSIACS